VVFYRLIGIFRADFESAARLKVMSRVESVKK